MIKLPVLVDVDCIHPREWNPNVMTDDKFNQLVEKIEDEDFTDPLKVCPCTPDEIVKNGWANAENPRVHYWIWAGEHRYRAAKVTGMNQVPCIIYEGEQWNEATQKLKMVRDNLVHGDLDAKKFTQLVKSLDGGMDIEPRMFGFTDRDEMEKFLIRDKEAAERSFLDGFMEAAGRQKEAVDALSDLVQNIFQQCMETIDQSYLTFAHKGNIFTVVLCNPATKTKVDAMLKHLHATGENINEFMARALEAGLIKKAG